MTNSTYLPVIVLLVAAVAFPLSTLLLAWLWAKKYSPHKPGPSKNAIYECGLESEGTPGSNSNQAITCTESSFSSSM